MEEKVGFGRRLGAFIIDSLIVLLLAIIIGPLFGSVLMGIFGALFGGIFAGITSFFGALTGILVAFLLFPLIDFVYFLLEGFAGISLGKLMLGIHVARKDGAKGIVGVYFLRFLIKRIGSATYLFGFIIALLLPAGSGFAKIGAWIIIIGFVLQVVINFGFFAALGSSKQGLHDLIMKTAVYRKKKKNA